MDIIKMLSELRSERERLEEAIIALERLARGQGKLRGRPPKWMGEPQGKEADQKEAPKKRIFSPETRARIAATLRKRWAAKKAETGSQ